MSGASHVGAHEAAVKWIAWSREGLHDGARIGAWHVRPAHCQDSTACPLLLLLSPTVHGKLDGDDHVAACLYVAGEHTESIKGSDVESLCLPLPFQVSC